MAGRFSIERKMDIDELCMCYTSSRKRFEAEFERCKAAGAKLYLLIENATWKKVLSGDYRSQMTTNALMASIFAFLARYRCQIIFCEPKQTGRIIKEIIYREAKEMLEGGYLIQDG